MNTHHRSHLTNEKRCIAELIAQPHAGRSIDAAQIKLIRQTCVMFPALSRRELAHTVCEHLEWYTANGRNSIHSCLGLLERMEGLGLVMLPEKDRSKIRTAQRQLTWGARSEAQPLIACRLQQLAPVSIEPVFEPAAVATWNELVDRHHYLKYRRPIGPHMRYFVFDKSRRPLGCVMFCYAARRLTCRDAWIGWQGREYKDHLDRVLCNSRFLMLPWVRVPHLASKALSLCARRIGDDWRMCHGYRPLLLETYVDDSRFKATCYRAANWQWIGHTDRRSGKTRKSVYVYPLVKHARRMLRAGAS